MTMARERLYLFDTTLRDGAQTQGVDFSVHDKRQIAAALDGIGIDYVEGGWPGANPTDTAFFADPPALTHAKLVAFGMTKRSGRSTANDPGLAAVLGARAPASCLVGKSWDFHVDVALGISLDENLALIKESIAAATKQGEALFDAEHFFDGYKANRQFTLACITTALEAGARWVVLCDTNGGTLPHEVEHIVGEVAKRIPGDRIGIHAHNDTENAVANTLAAIRAGARQVQGTLNGLGERCGNANLVSLIPTLMLKDDYATRFETGIAPDALHQITHVSRLLDELLNRAPNRHAAYVGDAAFAHKGGLHVSAVEKDPRTYEHVPPEKVGNQRHILVSDQAGRSNILSRLRDAGIEVDPKHPKLGQLLDEVKEREFNGYAYDGAEASFELLARRMIETRAGLFPRAALSRHGRAALERARRADHRVGSDRQRHRQRSAVPRSRGKPRRTGRRAQHRAAQGADPRLSRARGHQAHRLQGPYPDAAGRHQGRDARDDRNQRQARELVDGRRLARHHQRVVQRAARQHHLQAVAVGPPGLAVAGTNQSREAQSGGPAIILVEPQLGENIGTAARAMFNCGLTDLRLVKPRDGWPNDKAVAAASGADTVLDQARLYGTAEDAIADLNHVYVTTARDRYMVKRVLTPRAAAAEMRACDGRRANACGILFGPERTGLFNDAIALGDRVIRVPLNPAFSSLNLAQAVLLIGYEWFQSGDETPPERTGRRPFPSPRPRRSCTAFSTISRKRWTRAASCAPPTSGRAWCATCAICFSAPNAPSRNCARSTASSRRFSGRGKNAATCVDTGILAVIVAAHSRESGQKCPVPLTGVNYRAKNNI